MEKSKNIMIFKDITSEKWTLEDKVHAISYVLHMRNIKMLTAEDFRTAFKWFYDSLAEEEKPEPTPKINLDKYETNKFGIPKLNIGEDGISMVKKEDK